MNIHRILLLPLFIGLLSILACQKENPPQPDEKDPEPELDLIQPAENPIFIMPGDTLQLEARTEVTWSTSGGNLSAQGRFIAPILPGVFVVRAVSRQDTSIQAQRTIVVSTHASTFRDMRQGGHIIYFRHTTARAGTDSFSATIPQWWKSCDSTIARQLSPEGYVEAQEIGQAIKNLQLPIGKTISSEFCRCIETIAFMRLDLPIETTPAITFEIYGENDRYQRLLNLAAAQPLNDKLTLMSGHLFPNNSGGPPLQQGDAAIYRQTPNGGPVQFVKIIPLRDWTRLRGS